MAVNDFEKTWGNLDPSGSTCDASCKITIAADVANDPPRMTISCSNHHRYPEGTYHQSDAEGPERISDGSYVIEIIERGTRRNKIRCQNAPVNGNPAASWTADDSGTRGDHE